MQLNYFKSKLKINKKMKHKFISFVLLFVFIAFYSCNNTQKNNQDNDVKDSLDQENAELVLPALKNMQTPAIEKIISVANGTTFSSETGSEIEIPENAFVDKNGNAVTGDVKIVYKEIRSITDIIANDVDMTYDSAGTTHYFKTAGMFDIRALKDGEELQLKKDKKINISYASFANDENYNFYSFKDGKWIFEEASTVEKEQEPQNHNDNLIKPVKADPSNDLIIDAPVKYAHIAELKPYQSITWKYAGDKTKEQIIKLLSNRIKNPSIDKTTKKGIYKYTFTIKKVMHEIFIQPVFTGKAYANAMQQFNASTNRETPAMRKRPTSISTMGLKNYDIIFGGPTLYVQAKYKVKSTIANEVINADPSVFHIAANNVVVKQRNNGKIKYFSELENRLVAILPGNRVAVLNNEDFVKQINNQKDTKVEFELTLLDKKVESINELDQIIAEL